METFFLAEEKRAPRTQSFRDKNIFHDLFGPARADQRSAVPEW
jgi:hypothetical protein